ncbi:sensor histidine kinase [Mycetocola reblochoni]|uniref:histidine kinase n=2 Tax=Mycetocola reblochoni TaxID=331618 RepID=A0A1R4JX88_9MICO|nr:HAMP domain-containing sensor histidine kinase [Mycetocola reblochoni]RLP70600.1 sensor histidine kinase [Mycetocola reblochoni]SJN36710.1 Osmosensitive K+ channel histidine kinase KdpD [Mycetocola reblochoni REB411]
MTRLRELTGALTLRHRLVLIVVSILALGSIVVGYASVFAVQGQLYDRADEQLGRSIERLTGQNPNSPQQGAPGLIGEPGLGPGALGASFVNGELYSASYLDLDARATALTDEQGAILTRAAEGATTSTVDLGGDAGLYRVMHVQLEQGITVMIGTPLSDVSLTVSQLVVLITVITALVLAVAGAVAYGTIRLALRPLDRVAATAAAVSKLPLDRGDGALSVRVPEGDADDRGEVGRVGAAINRMLGHVSAALQSRQASENKVRRFVSDASHELRTPLAAISGYSELASRYGDEIPEDVAYSLTRIRSESARMAAIVEDLLLLARLDEGRELGREDVDLTMLVIDAVNDAHAAAPDHVFELDLPDEPVTLVGDRSRLHQVVANLLANARVHTPAGTHVTAGVELRGDDVVVSVSDDGPGIPPELRERVFERFVRGDDSRSRETGSTGLGLAIVSGIVGAHGGSADVSSVPGATRFEVRLPLAPAASSAELAPAEPSPSESSPSSPSDSVSADDADAERSRPVD